MLRGQLQTFGTLTLIAAILAQPVVAGTPGATSRRSTSRAATPKKSPTSDVRNAVATTEDSGNSVLQVAGRETVGKQLESRNRDPNRSLAILPSLFGNKEQRTGNPSAQTTRSNRAASSPQTSGILKGLFGTRKSSTPTPTTKSTRSARPATQTQRDVDWQGIPYHAAKSTNKRSSRAPIRDPRPGESRITSRVANQATTPKVTSSRVASPTLPKPPALADTTTRRVPQLAAAPSRVSRTQPATLSPLSSSRRSGRRDVPALDPSEIAAANAVPTNPEQIVPKFSRRPISRPETNQTNTPSVASKPATSSRRKTASSPTSLAGQDSASSQKDDGPVETSIGDMTREEMPPSSLAAAPSPAKPQVTSEPETSEPAAPKSMEIAAAPVKPAPKPVSPAKAPVVEQQAPIAPESQPAPEAIAASTPAMPPATEPKPAATQAPIATTVPTLPPTPVATPAPREQLAATPQYRSTPAAPAVPAMTADSQFSRQDNFRPVRPEVMNRMPSTPQFDTPGAVAGHRIGPPVNAFQQKAPLKPLGTPLAPSTAPIVGSGVAPQPNAQFDYPRIAQQPNYQPRAAVSPSPSFPRAPAYTQPQSTLPQSTQPQSIQPTAPMQPRYAPSDRGFARSEQTQPAPQTTRQPTTVRSATQPPRQPLRPNVIENAFGGQPFGKPQPSPRVATRPTTGSELPPSETAVASELPGLRVITHGPRSVMIRQTQEFEIRVENRGSIDATGLMVRARVPEWAEVKGQSVSKGQVESQTLESSDRLVWSIDSLAAGQSERMFVRLRATKSGIHPLDVDWTLLPQKSVAKIEVREPKLDLVIEGPGEVVFGESQTYRVRVLNPGDGIAPNVVFTLSPNSKNPQSQRIGDIPSGKEAQFEVELTAQDLGDLKINGLASGDLGLNAQAEKTVQVSSAALEAVLAGPEMQYQDTDAVYALQLTNTGSASSKNIEAVLTLPQGAAYRGGIDGARLRGNQLVWLLESLAPGETREFEFTCAMTAPGKQAISFAANGSAAGKTGVALDTVVESIADLVMTIQDPAAPAPVGSEVVYEIVIKNRGSRQARDVRAVAQFSNGIEPRRIEGHSGEVLTGQVLFDPISAIQPGQELRIRVVAVAEVGGHHRFRTEIRSGKTVLVAEEATQFLHKKSQRVSRHSNQSMYR
ncbi:MAG: hypothetical protein AAFV88_23265 [Planctomycetota bacterium]